MIGEAATIRRQRTIRSRLGSLALACILPAILIAVVSALISYQRERAVLERGTVATARALVQAVDLELIGVQSALQTLATSQDLAVGDLRGFYNQARKVLPFVAANNVVLTDRSGQQIINTLRPFGDPLPQHGAPELLRRVVDTGKPVIFDLFVGAVTHKPVIDVEVPVLIDGQVIYSAAMGILPERLSEILARQNSQPDRVVAIFDSTGTIVARTHNADQFIGKKGAPALVGRMSEVAEGVIATDTLEGIPVISSFSRSSVSGWSVAIGVPRAALWADFRQALLFTAIAAALVLVLGAWQARAISLRIIRSLHSLSAPALALGSGHPISVPATEIAEVNELGQALLQASQLIEQQAQERDAATAAERRTQRALRELSSQLMKAQDDERRRIAREIHDTTVQDLAAAKMQIEGVRDKRVSQGTPGAIALDDAEKLLEKSLSELRTLAYLLHPPLLDELGLDAAVRWYAGGFQKRSGIIVSVDTPALPRLPEDIEVTLFRVVQEGLANVHRHSGSPEASISFMYHPDRIELEIADEGRGNSNPVTPPANHTLGVGIPGMRLRVQQLGGTLEFESAGNGSTLRVAIPIVTASVETSPDSAAHRQMTG